MKNPRIVIKIYLSKAEKARIAANARKCRQSMSAYGRTLMLGHTPVNRVDAKQIEAVLKVTADLGRLGGLLKMLLTNDERLQDIGREMGMVTIDGVLVDIRATQAGLRELVEDMVRRAKHA